MDGQFPHLEMFAEHHTNTEEDCICHCNVVHVIDKMQDNAAELMLGFQYQGMISDTKSSSLPAHREFDHMHSHVSTTMLCLTQLVEH